MNKFILYSCVGHLALLIVLTIILIKPNTMKYELPTSLPSYIYHTEKKSIEKTPTQSKRSVSVKKLVAVMPAVTPRSNAKLGATSLATLTAGMTATPRNDHHDALLKLLHEAIAAKQHYPDSALLLQQTGTVTVSFYLFPDGHIEQMVLKKSSGTSSLDLAAQTAIQAIAPVQAAQIYVTHPTLLTVDVVFQ